MHHDLEMLGRLTATGDTITTLVHHVYRRRRRNSLTELPTSDQQILSSGMAQ